MEILTGKALPRRTFLRGLGAAVALPYLDAMVPTLGALTKRSVAAAPGGKTRFVAIESVHGAAGSNIWGASKNLWAPAGDREGFRAQSRRRADSARAVAQASHDRQQHRHAHGRSVRRAGDRRRPLPVERRVPYAVAPEADPGLGSLRRHVDGSADRAPHRRRRGDPVDAALHRESRPGRRLLLQLRVRIHGHDQLGEPERAAADDPQSAHGVRSAVRRGQQQRRPHVAPQGESEHSRLDHRRDEFSEAPTRSVGSAAARQVSPGHSRARAPHPGRRGAQLER